MTRRNLFPGTAALLLAAILSSNLSLRAQEDDPYPTGPEAGRQLAAKLRAIKPEESTNWHGVLGIFNRKPKSSPIPLDCQITVGETNWTATYVTAPAGTNLAEKFTVVFSTNGPNEYFYARATVPGQSPGETKQLFGAAADIPIGGSDFWLSDLGLEFLHWPDQLRLKGEMRSSRPCYVLVSTNPHPVPGGYSRVKTWIEKESGQPLIAEAFRFDNANKVMKSFSLDKVTNVNGHYQVKELEITGEGKFWTRLEMATESDSGKR